MGEWLPEAMPDGEPADVWPRVLFITPCAFNRVTGGGVTFSNLFRGWPKGRLACLTTEAMPLTFDVCEHYYRVGTGERRLGWPWSWRTPLCGAGGPIAGPTEDPPRPARPDVSRASESLRHRVLGTGGVPEMGVLSPRLRKWITDFRPEVIYTILGDTVMIDLVEETAREFQLPIVLHCMDDGVTEPKRTGLYGKRFNNRYRAGFRRLVDRAADRLAICDTMAECYAQRYHQPFAAFHNTVDFATVHARHRPADTLRNDPPRVLYAGSIYPMAQDKSLLNACAAVARLNEAGTPVELHIHADRHLFGKYLHRVEEHAYCSFLPALEDDGAFFEAITSADILLLPVNFDKPSIKFIGLSMPTKVPAYLASGTPTLVYGPRSVAQVSAALDDGWGLVVDHENPHDAPGPLDDALRRLIEDGALREQLAIEAAALAAEKHDAPVVRRRFRDTLRRATEKHA